MCRRLFMFGLCAQYATLTPIHTTHTHTQQKKTTNIYTQKFVVYENVLELALKLGRSLFCSVCVCNLSGTRSLPNGFFNLSFQELNNGNRRICHIWRGWRRLTFWLFRFGVPTTFTYFPNFLYKF